MSRYGHDSDFQEGRRDFERRNRPDMERDRFAGIGDRDRDYFDGFREAEAEARRSEERRNEERAAEEREARRYEERQQEARRQAEAWERHLQEAAQEEEPKT
jgi:hypothetical protein